MGTISSSQMGMVSATASQSLRAMRRSASARESAAASALSSVTAAAP